MDQMKVCQKVSSNPFLLCVFIHFCQSYGFGKVACRTGLTLSVVYIGKYVKTVKNGQVVFLDVIFTLPNVIFDEKRSGTY